MSLEPDTEQQLLHELRNHTLLFKQTNRTLAVMLAWLGILSVLAAAGLVFGDRLFAAGRDRDEAGDSWRSARVLVDKGDLTRGREMIGRLIAKNPRNYYGYRLLGFVEQESGNLKESEASFVRACELFPTDENEKNLAAIRKVREKDAARH